jgi:lipid-A-disaccharide synthase
MVVVYKTAWATYLIGRALVRLRWLGMVNIIAGRSLCPERIQRRANPASLAGAIVPLLDDGETRESTLKGLDEVIAALSGEGGDAADIVLEELGETP